MSDSTESRSIDQRVLEAPEDALAIDILGQYYREVIQAQSSGYSKGEFTATKFRDAVTQAVETVLRLACERLARDVAFSDICLSILGLRKLADRLLSPDCPWPILAIYEERNHTSSSSNKVTHQQSAERMIDRLSDWVQRITQGQCVLSFPLEIPSIAIFAKRTTGARAWLDALPLNATALHAPILLGARHVAGSKPLSDRFVQEARASILLPFRTQMDDEYVAGYLGAAIDTLHRLSEDPSGDDSSRSELAIDALLAIEEAQRLTQAVASMDTLKPFLDRAKKQWLSEQTFSDEDRRSSLRDLHHEVSTWMQRLLVVAPGGSALADSILLGNDSQIPSHLRSGLVQFDSPENAWRMLQELATEQIRVLSSRNCRYHFSKIAQPLLACVLKTPSPDLTLRNIVSTTNSLGGKGVLWELFASHRLLMELYTRLCGTSQYLVQILLSNPGMIDDLLDSLMLQRIPDYAGFQSALDSLCKGQHEIERVVTTYKNSMHLAIGVRDILGRESITEIHRALADVHEVCIEELARQAYRSVSEKSPKPLKSDGSEVGFAILLVGKVASREPNYHSDISMLVLHDSPQANHGVFFQQVGQKLIQMANRVTRFGRLFEIKAWQFQGLASSGVAWTTDSLIGSISNSVVHPEQKLNLYTARVLGDSPLARQTESRLEQFLHTQEWNDQDSYALVQWRRELESSASEENIKRGWGGTLDVEVLAHIFYAKHLHTPKHPWLRGTVERLEALRKYGVLAPHVALQLRDAYYFLRGVESGLRLMNTKLRHDLPRDPLEQSKLAFVLQLPDSKQLMESCDYYRTTIQGLSQFNFAKIRAQVLGAS